LNRGFGFVTAVSIYRGILLIPYRKTVRRYNRLRVPNKHVYLFK
jgi:hypothetical protein